MPALAPQIMTTPHSGIRRMVEMAGTVDEPLLLVSGDPNFATPAHIVAGAAAAAYAGATLSFGPEYLIPKPFDPRLILELPPAVAEAAMKSGVACSRPAARTKKCWPRSSCVTGSDEQA